jgi:hypothetical protein
MRRAPKAIERPGVFKGVKALACLALVYCAFSFVILNIPRKVFEEKVSFGAF